MRQLDRCQHGDHKWTSSGECAGGRNPHCEVPGCTERTREGKPYCPSHVDRHGYVARVVAMNKRRDEEIKKAERGRPVADGVLAEEVVTLLSVHGCRSAAHMTRELNMPFQAVVRLLDAMARAGKVTLTRTPRGAVTAHSKCN